ncbi:MAG: glycosyltransferase [Caldilinea sp. CFX5]|nr:glycosyltransferase [Caldilinea sp. CFX5]
MKIVHVSTSDNIGGAARAAYRLHQGLHQLGCNTLMFVARRTLDNSTISSFQPLSDLLSHMQRTLRRQKIVRDLNRYSKSRSNFAELFSDERTQHVKGFFAQIPNTDVINLHWINRFVDLQAFLTNVPTSTKLIWTLHDMNTFTGGCHYDYGCGKYTQQCGACPQLGSNQQRDLSFQILQRKRKAYQGLNPNRFQLVAPSRWMAQQVKRSTLMGHYPVHTIPYGLNVAEFAPMERDQARAELGLPQDAKIILFVAYEITDQRKGLDLLSAALNGMTDYKDLHLVSLGKGKLCFDLGIPHTAFSSVEDDRRMAMIYSAADIFVITSRQDNLPNTVMESMACGTPVVGFDVGGIPDMIRPGKTGLLAPVGHVQSLRDAIATLLDNQDLRSAMAVNCRCIAVEEYALEVQASRYVALYQSMLSKQ